jgi:hypothetical protein
MAEAMGCQAYWRPAEHSIRIRPDIPAAQQAVCLVHECIHAIFATAALKPDSLSEESVCSALDGPLTALFTDNPWLAGVLHQAVNHGKAIVK